MEHLGDQLAFGALQAGSGWSSSILRRGALVLFTANGAHRSLTGYLLAIGNAGMAGCEISHISQNVRVCDGFRRTRFDRGWLADDLWVI